MCIGWLQDCVYTIRQSAILNLQKLVEVFGLEWARTKLLPGVFEATQSHTNYLFRMSALSAIAALAGTIGAEILMGTMLPIVLQMQALPHSKSCSLLIAHCALLAARCSPLPTHYVTSHSLPYIARRTPRNPMSHRTVPSLPYHVIPPRPIAYHIALPIPASGGQSAQHPL
jgi:hypothetical protein